MSNNVALVWFKVNSLVGEPIKIIEENYVGVDKDESGAPGYFITVKGVPMHLRKTRLLDARGVTFHDGRISGAMWALKSDTAAINILKSDILDIIEDLKERLDVSMSSIIT